jgi:hypothetical protein
MGKNKTRQKILDAHRLIAGLCHKARKLGDRLGDVSESSLLNWIASTAHRYRSEQLSLVTDGGGALDGVCEWLTLASADRVILQLDHNYGNWHEAYLDATITFMAKIIDGIEQDWSADLFRWIWSDEPGRWPLSRDIELKLQPLAIDLRQDILDFYNAAEMKRMGGRLEVECYKARAVWDASPRTDEEEEQTETTAFDHESRLPQSEKIKRGVGAPGKSQRNREWAEEFTTGINNGRWGDRSAYIEWKIEQLHKLAGENGEKAIGRDAIEKALKQGLVALNSEKTKK